jgi:protein SCO1
MKQPLLSPQKLTSIAIAVACVFSLVSCTKTATQTETQASASASPQPADPGVKHYQLTGRVVAIDKPNKSLTVDGDDIPGFMSAMQMPYDVKDSSLMDKLAPGDKIKADVVVKGDESWLEKIRVTQPSTPAAKPSSILRTVKVSAA